MTLTAKKVNKHPQLYTIFKPNELIKAKKFNMNFIEKRVYYEILNHNHHSTPEETIYSIPYEYVLNPNDIKSGNRKINARRISQRLMKRIFYFDSSFMHKVFGDDAEGAMLPFPEINCYDDCFKVHVHHRFKKILTLIGMGFTKGDMDTLRSFNHEITDEFYWLIRQRQTWGGTWEVPLGDLKEMVGLDGKYEVYQNFKTKVLDRVKEDCKGTWTEFDYKPIRRGKGAPVHSIKFFFKNGPKQEKDAPAGEDFPWEEKLLALGVLPEKVKEIRNRVKVRQENAELDFVWDSEYVLFSIEAVKVELKEKKKDSRRKQIANIPGYVYNGLITGQWVHYVQWRKEKIFNEVQKSLEFTTPPRKIEAEPQVQTQIREQIQKFNSIAQDPDNRSRPLPPEIVQEWQALYVETKMNEKKTFKEFMALNNIVPEGEKWVKLL